jgi:hypothetical protein
MELIIHINMLHTHPQNNIKLPNCAETLKNHIPTSDLFIT